MRRANEAAAAERRRRDLERAAKEKAAGTTTVFERDDDTGLGWGRGTKIEEAKKTASDYDRERNTRMQERVPDNNNFVRGQNVVKADTKTDEPFTRKPREEDTGFMSRSAMMGQKPAPGEESKEKPAEKKPSGPPMFTRTKKPAPTDGSATGT